MSDPMTHYAAISMVDAEPGWWAELPTGEVHPVVAWAVARDFSNRKAPNRTVPMVIDSEMRDLRELLDPPGQYRLFFDLDREVRFDPQWSAA